jgi:hypothetical protein
MHASLENLARMFPSHAESSAEDSPFLTINDFEVFAMSARDTTWVKTVLYAPFILDNESRSQWETYSVSKQSWIVQSAAFHPDFDWTDVKDISPRIWLRDGNGFYAADPGPGPYVPIWQVSPPPSDTFLINFNLASEEYVEEWINLQEFQNDTWSFLSPPVNASTLFGGDHYHEEDLIEPVSLAWFPVMPNLLLSEDDDEPSGAFVADVRWTTLMRDVSNSLFQTMQQVSIS